MPKVHASFALAALALLAGCGGQSAPSAPPGDSAPERVPLDATAEAEPARSFLPDAFRAFGNEPFWSADVAGGKLTWSTPADYEDGGDGKGQSVPVTRSDGAEGVTLTATVAGAPLTLVVTDEKCSDGMSDATHPWTVKRTLGGDSVQGCAEPPKPD